MPNIRANFLTLILAITFALCTTGAQADYSSSQRWFNARDDSDRRIVQSSLLLLGYYSGLADGKFGKLTYDGLIRFQGDRGYARSGVLSKSQYDRLFADAVYVFNELGFEKIVDHRGGVTMLLPTNLLPEVGETLRGTSYASYDHTLVLETINKSFADESYLSLYEKLSSGPNRSVSYKTIDSDRFVVSGTRNAKRFYTYIHNTSYASVGFSIEWTPEANTIGAMIATFLASYAAPGIMEDDSSAKMQEWEEEPPPKYASTQSAPQPPAERRGNSSGTGFFVAERGVLVTNQHVVDQCETVRVPGYGTARIVTSDAALDLAVLQLDTPVEHPVAKIRSSPTILGEAVLALGFPLSFLMDSTLTIGTGIVSAQSGLGGEKRWFTTNVGIQPGSSGGPVLDENGHILGVAVAKINDEALLQAMGTTAPNLGFAIKGEVLADYLSIFRFQSAGTTSDAPLSPKKLTELGSTFTVQILCETN